MVAGKLGANAVLPGNLGNGIITTNKLSDGAVIASKIKNGVVTTNKLNNGAVTTAKLGDGSVTLGKLADGIAPLLGTLRSGQTLRGVFDLGEPPAAPETSPAARSASSSRSLNQPDRDGPEKRRNERQLPGLGGGATPQATAGKLCVYITESKNLDRDDAARRREQHPARLRPRRRNPKRPASTRLRPVGGDGAVTHAPRRF